MVDSSLEALHALLLLDLPVQLPEGTFLVVRGFGTYHFDAEVVRFGDEPTVRRCDGNDNHTIQVRRLDELGGIFWFSVYNVLKIIALPEGTDVDQIMASTRKGLT